MGNIIYIHYGDIYEGLVDSIQPMRMCEAFQDNDHNVIIVYPDFGFKGIGKINSASVWEYYGIEQSFELLPYKFPFRKFAYNRGGPTLALWRGFGMLSILLSLTLSSADLVYSRYHFGVFLLWAMRRLFRFQYKIAFELHEDVKTTLLINTLRQIDTIIVISHGARRLAAETYKISPNKILLEPDAAKLEAFSNIRDIAILLPSNSALKVNRLVYAGSLHEGLPELLCDLGKRLENQIEIIVLGGSEEQIKLNSLIAKEKGCKNLHYLGYVRPSEVPGYLKAADILLLWYPNNLRYIDYISPVKLFEYMAAKKPIVAADFPAIREILNDKENALLVKYNDIDGIEYSIRSLLQDEKLTHALATRARSDVKQFTWKKRAQRILDFVLTESRDRSVL